MCAKMRAYKNPFRGQRRPDAKGANKQHHFRKKGKRDEGKKGPHKKSVWGLLGAVGSFAAVWVFTVWKLRDESKQKQLSDRPILNRMLLSPMTYTDHAVCRMKCRFVTEREVTESLQKGKINSRKSEPRSRPCPKYVVDASVGRQKKRIETVFSACPGDTRVVTVIDRDTDWACYCP